jgi:hypothetical protein
MKKWIVTTIAMACLFPVFAQQDSNLVSKKMVLSAYAELYYAYDFANPASHERPEFLYNHKRHNEINLNLGYIKAAYNSGNVRANFALMTGTYAQYNLAHEQGLLKNVYESNAGLKLSNKRNLWLDAGILTSHIGFESAISKDCWTLTRSIVAENSPYYLSGAKLTYITNNGKWLFLASYINGWQRIQRVTGQNKPNFSTQIQFKPNDKLTLNYSTFVGSVKPDTSKQMRHYHNVYAIWQASPKWGLILGFDYGQEQQPKESSKYNQWIAPVAILRYSMSDKFTLAARWEYFNDKNGVMIATGTPSNFQTMGYSINFDYKPENNILLRVEGRMFDSKDKLFKIGKQLENQNYMIATSIAVSL